jgi:hypothetical protein
VIGVGLISISALSEAVVGNIQENVLSKHRCVMLEIVFWSNFFSAMIVLLYLIGSGELIDRCEKKTKREREGGGGKEKRTKEKRNLQFLAAICI